MDETLNKKIIDDLNTRLGNDSSNLQSLYDLRSELLNKRSDLKKLVN